MEYWDNGMMEYWKNGIIGFVSQIPNIPIFHHSNIPI